MNVEDNVQNHFDDLGQKSLKISEWNPKQYFTKSSGV